MKELVVLTHNDLDALGSMLNIEYKMSDIQKKYFYTNYANLDKIIDDIELFAKSNECTHILIADVSFGDNKQALRRLYNLGKCTHIDHHLYPDGFWDEFRNMKVYYDKTKSATKLCNEFFKNAGKNANLDKLTYLIDVYDIWRTKNEHFDLSQDLNEYFWSSVQYGDLLPLANKIISNEYKLPNDYLERVNNIKVKRDKDIKSFEDNHFIQRSSDVAICFISEWFNHVMINEMRNGKNFVIGINSKGIIRVRIREEAPYTDVKKNKLRLALTGTETTGHMNAFTYLASGKITVDRLIKEAEQVSLEIQKIKE